MSMLFIPVLFLLSAALCGASVVDSVHSYEHQDPLIGDTINCSKCPQGYHMSAHYTATMLTVAECGPGNQTEGTLQTNTVCEKCPEGYFSSSSSAVESCVKHQECASGQSVLLAGSVYYDTVCGTCESLANEGETLRTFLSGFFSMHRMRARKMKKFIARYIFKSGEERCTGDNLPNQRGPLLDHIIDWLAQAPEAQLRKLPHMLRASQLNSMAEKLKKRE